MRAKEFFKEGEVINLPIRNKRTDQQKYDDELMHQQFRSDLGIVPCPYCEDLWCNIDCERALADKSFDEGDVIDTKFMQKLGQKKGMFYNPDAEPPVSRKDNKPFDRFEVKPLPYSDKSATIVGVRANGYKEELGTTTKKLAHILASAYNAGGYSSQEIKKVSMKPKTNEKVVDGKHGQLLEPAKILPILLKIIGKSKEELTRGEKARVEKMFDKPKLNYRDMQSIIQAGWGNDVWSRFVNYLKDDFIS